MIVEQILSLAQPGRTGEYLSLFEAQGYPLLSRLPGQLVGLFRSEAGLLEQIVELWAFQSPGERDARSAQLADDPACRAYLAQVEPLLVRREARLLTPAPFFRLPPQDATALPT